MYLIYQGGNRIIMGSELCIVCWLFDSGKFDNPFYGEEIISLLFDQKCLFENEIKMVFLTGDIIDANISSDCSQIAIRDELCTISKLPEASTDLLYAVVVEDIEAEIASKVDRALSAHEAYCGMTSVAVESTDSRKLFWKELRRSFSLHKRMLTAFGSEEAGFVYKSIAEEKGLEVCFSDAVEAGNTYDVAINYENDQTKNKPNSNRGRLEMNFAMVKEVEVAGALIWKSIKDLDRAKVEKDSPVGGNNISYLFMAFYQAAQGIERLQKIVIELMIKNNPPKDNELKGVEELLRSHNHIELHDYIKKRSNTCINKNDRHFLETLRIFYKDARYGRYSYSDDNEREATLLHELGKSLQKNDYDNNVKNCFGKALARISKSYYDLIKDLSYEINIYVYEIDAYSDANYVFYNDEKESLYKRYKQIEQSKKELLYYLMIRGRELLPETIIKDLSVLDFDTADIPNYIMALVSDCNSVSDLYDYVDYAYDELAEDNKEKWKERIEIIKNIHAVINVN